MSHARQSLGRGTLVAWIVAACCLVSATASQALTQDLTSQFTITRTGIVLNRTTNTFDSTATLRNSSGAPILAPIDVVIGGLPAGVTLANKVGDKPDGRPYVSPMAAASVLQNGASLTFVLKYSNPSRVTFSSTLQVLREIVDAPSTAPTLLGVVATGGSAARLTGRVEGAANQDVTLQLTSANTCIAGTLVNGTNLGGAVTVRTDAGGYFQLDVSGVNSGAFVSLKGVAAGSPSSPCQVSSRDNDSWPKAFLLEGPGPTARDLIDVPGRARWYKFAVTPGQRIDLKLTGLPADYDLAVFKDIGQAFAGQFNPVSASTNDLLRLTAEYAPSTFSPSTFSPSTFSPSTFSPDAYSPSTFSPSTFSPSVFSPSTFSPSTFSPSTFSPSTFSPSTFSPSTFSPSTFSPSTFSPSIYTLTEVQQAFSTAQTRSIVAISATPGLSDEATVVNTWNRTGYFYARVTGRGGAFDTSIPFTLSVTKGITTCVGVTDTVLTPRPAVAASGLKTVLLTDSSRLSLDSALPGPAGNTLRSRLATFAARSEIQGVVIDVAGDGRVNALRQQAANNPACPYAKNLVAEEIKGIVDTYRSNPLQYVVIIGNDDAIPFFRSPDQSVIGQESGYVPPVESNSASEASLRRDFVLSQDRYGSKTSISLPWNDFPVPGLAVGRLVETPGEIAGLIDAYVAAGSVVSPRSSLVTGYDFLEDAANAVKEELDAGTGSAGDALITPNGVSPQAPASWNAEQLRAKLFGSRHDVIFLAGHFSANSALAADFTTSVLTTDVAASTTDFTNSIVFSAGCHAGYNLVDADAITGVTLPLDWAQAFSRKQATLIAGTGYQYGDTDFLEYSERLYNNLARQLRAGPAGTPVAIGEALVQAKLAYLASIPDIRGLHEKALLEATLFGLPMLGVNMPAGRGALPGTSGAVSPTPVLAGPAATLGLETYDLGVAPNLTARTQTLTNLQGGPTVIATWLNGPDGVVTKPGEPALPLAVVNVTPTDPHFVLRGIGYRGGAYVDSGPLVPLTGAATTESRGVHVPFLSPVFYPSTLWTPNYFGALAGNGGTQLLVSPAQYRAASVTDGTSTQRRHTGMNLRLFYSANLSQAALSDAPSIVAVEAQQDATGVTFTAQVVGNPAAAIYQVWVTYTGDGIGTWTSLDLSQCVAPLPAACGVGEDSRLWRGRLSSPPANIKYFVQAANGVGLVSRSDNAGAFFAIGSLIPAATAVVLVAPPPSAIIGDSPTVTARLTYAGGVGLAGKIVAVGAGGAARLGTTGSDGSVTVRLPVVADPGSYLITAAFAGDEVFQPSSVSAPLTINRAAVTPTVLPPSPGAASAGINITGALGSTNTGLQGVPVTFTVNVAGSPTPITVYSITDYLGNAIFPPPSGLPPGNYTVTQASFGGNGTFAPTTITFPTPLQVAVPKLNQSIDFDPLADKTLGDSDFPLFAVASSSLGVAYSASGSCTVAGSTVHLTGTGSCSISASQAGDTTYNAAATVSQSFSIAAGGGGGGGPTVSSLVRAAPNPTMADTVTYTVTFSEAVTGGTASNFLVFTSGITSASVADVSGTGATRTVTVNTGRGSGSLRLDLVNSTGIASTGGAPLVGVPPSGEIYSIDKGGSVIGGGEGQPVPGFGNGGYALFSADDGATTPGRTRARPDGRILAAGGIQCFTAVPADAVSPFRCTLQLAQFTSSGAPDATFGTNGRVVTVVTDISPDTNLSLNADGTAFVKGVRHNGTANVPFVAKFTTTGTPDASFGTNGVVMLNSLPLGFGIIGAPVDASGRIVIAGTTPDTGVGEREDIFVTRLTSTGATDTTFGTNGVAQFALSNVDNRSDRASAADVQPDGKIIIGGRTRVTSGAGYDFLLMRLDGSGVRDPSFGNNGVVTANFLGGAISNLGRRFVQEPDGHITLVGTVVFGPTSQQCGVARFDEDGVPDPGFGTAGRLLLSSMNEGCFNIGQQPDGKLIVVGTGRTGDVFYATYARLGLTGAADPTFGSGGHLQISSYDTPTRTQSLSSGIIVTGLTVQDTADGVVKSYVVELGSTIGGAYLAQTIAFNPIPDKAYGDVFQVSAQADSGLTVSFTASGVCSVADSMVQLSGIGSCTITAHQTGNGAWLAAPSVSRTFAVTPAGQVITFGPAPIGATAEQLLVTVIATSSSATAAASTTPIVLSSLTPAVCSLGGLTAYSVTPLAAGTCTIAANQAGSAVYTPAPQATVSFAVGPAVAPGTTFIVSNTSDSGAGSLREAVALANAEPGVNAISFAGVTGAITLTSGQIQISGPLIIAGPGADQLTINGSGTDNGRIFSIYATDPACPALDGPDYLVSISGLTFANGRRGFDQSGGAIFSEHSLALDSVVIRNSTSVRGGGMTVQLQYPGQTLSIKNSKFLDNVATELTAPGAGSNTAAGGGLNVQDRCTGPVNTVTDIPSVTPVAVTIANSEFRGNFARPLTLSGRGGGIRFYSFADVTITDTIVADNHLEAPNPPTAGRTYNGGGLNVVAKSLRIERSEIAENTVFDVTAADVTRSGGLHVGNDAVTRQSAGDAMGVRIINTTISGNSVSATAGALLAYGNTLLEFDNATVSDNSAGPTRTGGVVVTSGATYPTSANNTARPRLTLVSSILANNSSTGGDLVGNQTTLPTFTVNATNSLVERICATSGCSAITVAGTGNFTSVGATPGPDPLLGPLAFNGGTTRTHALLAGSPAINTGSNPFGLTTDQRGSGFLRVVGGVADMGAYESGQSVPFGSYTPLNFFGSSGAGNGQFSFAFGLAIDPVTRNIIVADTLNNRVQILSSTGAYLSQFGGVGAGNGQLNNPNSIAIDAVTRNIIVTDTVNARVQIFTPAGVYVSQFGSLGFGNGQFIYPAGVAVDPVTRNIVVVDYGNDSVQIFSSAGVYLSRFGTNGTGNGQFRHPWKVAIDPSSRDILVVDQDNNRVQIFSSSGGYLSQFGATGTGNGQLTAPSGIAIDPTSHNIVVADRNNNRVQVFSSAGAYLTQFGSVGLSLGQFISPLDVAIDPVNHRIVVNDGLDRVQIFAAAGEVSTNYAYQSQFGAGGFGNGQFNAPVGVAIDPTSNNIVVVDSASNRVQIFNSAGTYLSHFGSSGLGNGQFNLPPAVAIDPVTHNMVVTDNNNHRVQIFSSAGVYLSQFGTPGSGNGQFNFPFGVAIDPTSRNIVVVDAGNFRVQIFSSGGVYLSQFGTQGTGDGQFGFAPKLVAIDASSHNIAVVDSQNNRVQLFTSTGTYLSQFGGSGAANGQFNSPQGVAIDPVSRNIVVTDSSNSRVQVFNSAGAYVSQFGVSGAGNGQFAFPAGVAIDPASHKIVVVDRGNNRVQIFAPQ